MVLKTGHQPRKKTTMKLLKFTIMKKYGLIFILSLISCLCMSQTELGQVQQFLQQMSADGNNTNAQKLKIQNLNKPSS